MTKPTQPQESTAKRVCALDLIARSPWAIEATALETLRAVALRENESVEALEARYGQPLLNTRTVSTHGAVAVIPIAGPIFRYANMFTKVSGATSLDILAKDFTAAIDSAEVSSVVLSIDSPGGQVTGIAEFAKLVSGAKKPVVAYVDGSALSAAYWIAAACSKVVISQNGQAGSVGAILSVDTRREIGVEEIVSSQSPNKRPDVTTDSGKAQIQSIVDAHAKVFIESVAAFRRMTPAAVMRDWNGGGVFVGADAVSLGLGDSVGSLEELLSDLNTKPAPTRSTMSQTAAVDHVPAMAMEDFSALYSPASTEPAITPQSISPAIDAAVAEVASLVEAGTRDGFVTWCGKSIQDLQSKVAAKHSIQANTIPPGVLLSWARSMASGWAKGVSDERARLLGIDNVKKLLGGYHADLVRQAQETGLTAGQLGTLICEGKGAQLRRVGVTTIR
ncbi:MAG: S49 family peptidase [Zoogloeaceae bacterium]|nr:S49 family peptidase [Zoogloeaceae bacterium]